MRDFSRNWIFSFPHIEDFVGCSYGKRELFDATGIPGRVRLFHLTKLGFIQDKGTQPEIRGALGQIGPFHFQISEILWAAAMANVNCSMLLVLQVRRATGYYKYVGCMRDKRDQLEIAWVLAQIGFFHFQIRSRLGGPLVITNM
jgi:hypothetical protein